MRVEMLLGVLVDVIEDQCHPALLKSMWMCVQMFEEENMNLKVSPLKFCSGSWLEVLDRILTCRQNSWMFYILHLPVAHCGENCKQF